VKAPVAECHNLEGDPRFLASLRCPPSAADCVSIANGFADVLHDGNHTGRHLIQAQRKSRATAVIAED